MNDSPTPPYCPPAQKVSIIECRARRIPPQLWENKSKSFFAGETEMMLRGRNLGIKVSFLTNIWIHITSSSNLESDIEMVLRPASGDSEH